MFGMFVFKRMYRLLSLYEPLGGEGLSQRGGGPLLGGLLLGLDTTLGGRTAAAVTS